MFEAAGCLVRGHPVQYQPITTYKWLNLSRLSYGVPEDDIRRAVAPYGDIRVFKLEQYANIYTGVRHVLMDIRVDIPMRIRIAGQNCVVHYKGQKRPCFSCGQVGHFTDKCPSKAVPGIVQSEAHTLTREEASTVSFVLPGVSFASRGAGIYLASCKRLSSISPRHILDFI